ncbi:MAG: hypothetical protein ABGZ24_18175, partial [Fuerstiella sp.]
MDKTEHAVAGAFFQRLQHGLVKLVSFFEVRSFVPERSGDDIRPAIGIDVCRRDPVTVVLVGEDNFFASSEESVGEFVFGKCSKVVIECRFVGILCS